MKINNKNFNIFLHTLETYEAQNGFGKNPKDFINQIIMRINKNTNNAPIDLLNIANDLPDFIHPIISQACGIDPKLNELVKDLITCIKEEELIPWTDSLIKK